MNTTKHTPGPLHVGDGKRALIVYRSDGYSVADCKTFHGKVSQEEAESNAVLFAAAPELLAELEAACIVIQAYTPPHQWARVEKLLNRLGANAYGENNNVA